MGNPRLKSYATDILVAKFNFLNRVGLLTDAAIAAITDQGTYAKLRTVVAAFSSPVPKTRNILLSVLAEMDRANRLGTLTDAVVDAARDAGSANFSTLISGIVAISGTPSNTQPYSVWS